jgi:hypothetical protein
MRGGCRKGAKDGDERWGCLVTTRGAAVRVPRALLCFRFQSMVRGTVACCTHVVPLHTIVNKDVELNKRLVPDENAVSDWRWADDTGVSRGSGQGGVTATDWRHTGVHFPFQL